MRPAPSLLAPEPSSPGPGKPQAETPWTAGDLSSPGADSFSRYRILGLLGAGGVGLVYEAIHLALDTTVAIKVLRPELLELDEFDEHAACITEEAHCLAVLSSDHVVRVLDAGWLETGAPFLVMERLAGADLGVVVKACGRLAVPIAVDYARETCAALAEPHSLHLIHCDIKPTNLFLASRRLGSPRIKLIGSTQHGLRHPKTVLSWGDSTGRTSFGVAPKKHGASCLRDFSGRAHELQE